MRPAAIGSAVGTAAGTPVAALSRGATLVPWPARVRTAFPFALGGVVGGVVALKVGFVASTLRAIQGRGRGPVTAGTVGMTAALAGVGVFAGTYGRDVVLTRMASGGRELDPGFATPPTLATVSGSVESAIPVASLGREGARFVGTTTSADDVQAVMGQSQVAEPVRVFIGVETADTIEERVALAMAELRRTGAFDRQVLLVQASAGSGYANATPVDILEILTRGNSAAVSIGYGLLPSFLSLGKVQVAARTQQLLLDAIRDELAERPQRPTLLLYGESLGAKVQEAAVAGGPIDLDHYGISHALWVGTPGGKPADAFHERCAGESITVDRPEQIPATFPSGRPRVWFLEHDGDPVVRFRPELMTARPAWLPVAGERGRNVPATMQWRPGITWAQVLVDTLFATHIKPGDFQSLGHDYRADLGGVVPAAFGFDLDAATAERLEARLRQLEIQRAARINGT